MRECDVVLIGGTGVGERLAAFGWPSVAVPTEFGLVRGSEGVHQGRRIMVVQRHGAGHKNPPHKVNYRAIARAAQLRRAKAAFSTAAVGCLRAEWPVGCLAVCTDFLDLTFRNLTMHDRQVRHVDFSDPLSGRVHLQAAADALGLDVQPQAVYVGLNGPRYETPAEIGMVDKLGGDLVGMTASSEAVCFREVGVTYGLLGIVTNLASGLNEGPLTHEEVVEVVGRAGQSATDLLLKAATLV